jgi:hypothetical protein
MTPDARPVWYRPVWYRPTSSRVSGSLAAGDDRVERRRFEFESWRLRLVRRSATSPGPIVISVTGPTG